MYAGFPVERVIGLWRLLFLSLSLPFGTRFSCALRSTWKDRKFSYSSADTQSAIHMMHFTCCLLHCDESFSAIQYGYNVLPYFSLFKTPIFFFGSFFPISNHHSDLEAIKINGHSRLSLSLSLSINTDTKNVYFPLEEKRNLRRISLLEKLSEAFLPPLWIFENI